MNEMLRDFRDEISRLRNNNRDWIEGDFASRTLRIMHVLFDLATLDYELVGKIEVTDHKVYCEFKLNSLYGGALYDNRYDSLTLHT